MAHFFCPRCGSILLDFSSLPSLCPRCGGVEIKNIGKEGDYTAKEVRKKYSAPFRQDIFYRNPKN